jgi:hypothetical protein
MPKLKEGDTFVFTRKMKAAWISHPSGTEEARKDLRYMEVGKRYTVIGVEKGGDPNKGGEYYKLKENADKNSDLGDPYVIYIDPFLNLNQNNMNLYEEMATLQAKEPKKSFIKAGVVNSEGYWTDSGSEIFKKWLRDKFEKEFNEEVVQPILKARKDKNK